MNEPGARDINEALLMIYAKALENLEHARIGLGNNIYAFEETKKVPAPDALVMMMSACKKLEKEATRALEKTMAAHELGEWVANTFGIGMKTSARLLAAIGDPLEYEDQETGEIVPRTVSKLWAYCGLHTVDGKAPKRAKGIPSNWNEKARAKVFVMADAAIYQSKGKYREVYDNTRKKYEDEDISDGQKHARALRAVSKEILKDIYNEAKEIRREKNEQ